MAAVGGQEATSILQALQVALDVTGAGKDKRKAASDFLEQVKLGEVHSVTNAALFLVQASQPLEVRHYAFSLLQHVAHSRWSDVPPAERNPLANLFLQLLATSGGEGEPWAIKSRAAALVAEVIRQEGPKLLEEVLPPLREMAQQGPVQAETVAMLLRWLPEDVTVHNEDLDAPARRALLGGLTSNLSTILPLLYNLASVHCGAAMAAVQSGRQLEARPHAAVVTAALAAADAYSDWAPVVGLESSRLIEAAGALLQAREFRDGAAEFLKHVAGRRRPTDERERETLDQHDAALGHVAASLVAAAPSALTQAQASDNQDEDRDYAERIAEGLAAVGSMNAAAVAGQGPTAVTAFLTQVLGFLSSSVALANPILPGVTSLLRDAAAPKDKAKPKPGPSLQLPPEWTTAVLEAVHEKVRRCSGHGLILEEGVEGSSEDNGGDCPPEFESGRDYGTYRGKLSDVIRLVGGVQPQLAVEYACRQVMTATTAAAQAPRPAPKEVLVAVEAAHVVLENVLAGAPSTALEAAARSGGQAQQDDLGLATPLEAMLLHLLSLQVSAAGLVHLQGRLFDACGPYLAFGPAAVPNVLHKLLLMLQGLVLPPGSQHSEPSIPAHGNPRDKAPIWSARLLVCTSILRVARSAGSGLVPHLESIAGAIGQMHSAGQLTPSEHNSLAEAIMVISTSAGAERQAQVLEWLLAPLRQQWVDSAWQQTISTPAGLATLLQLPQSPAANGLSSGPAPYWWIYHAISLFEKALRRSAPHNQAGLQHVRVPRSPSTPPPAVGRPTTPPAPPHPMGQHLGWIVPPLLHLLQAVHRLWEPEVQRTLSPTLQAALRLGPLEIGVLLGSQGRPAAESHKGISPPEEEQVPRNWLKGVREAGYTVLGTAAARVPGFFDRSEWGAVAASALTGSLAAMEIRHLRLLIKSVVSPIVSHCPPPQWEAWLAPLVPPVLAQAHTTLAGGWAQLATQTGGPPLQQTKGGAAEEILLDKMVRDLSRDVCSLLALFAPSSFPPTKPEPSQQIRNQVDPGLLGWLLQHPPAAAAGLELATQALTWPDTEAAQKALILASGAAQVAPADPRLHELVGRTLLATAVRALALESNAQIQADLLALVLDIYLRLAPVTPAVRQVLSSLPNMTSAALAEFEAAVGATSSVKEQRVAVRTLLQGGAGGQLRALTPQKAGNVITNLTDRGNLMQERSNARQLAQEPESQGGPIGLALFQ